ncbi:MAG: hypothetical protein H6619_05050 [Deltaproteobacteria bacterium]|nr:hypothetical protein [Deltaproteobacteria bacterium]
MNNLVIKLGAIAILAFSNQALAISLKGKLPTSASSVTATAVISDSETQTTTLDSASDSNFTLSVGGKDARMTFTQNNNALPVLFAVKNASNKVITVKKAIKQGICGDTGVVGLSVIKKKVTGNKKMIFKAGQISSSDAFYYLKRIKNVANINSNVKKYVSKAVESSLNSDCSPTGNAATFGLGSSAGSSSILAASDGDTDSDGLADEFDIDHDGDGILNNYDPDYTEPSNSFSIFTNLKVTIDQTINSNVITGLTDTQVDNLLQSTQTMAIEVKAADSSNESSELFCGDATTGLEYCRPGGTGAVLMSSTAFPDDVDTDSDGGGTITKGGTGDFQLKTGVTDADNIGSGDTLTQVVTDSDTDTETTYIANLDFAFTSTPAISALTLDPAGTNTSLFTEASYPVSGSGTGTSNSPFSVTTNGSGKVVLGITTYRPERPGITGAGEADLMQIGNSLIVIDIPNAPSSGGTAAQGPGGCAISTYSESDTDLSISGDTLVDAQGDFDGDTETDGDGNKTVTFSVNITDCLATVSETLDSGEKLKIDLQFKNSAGDNTAQAFYIAVP